MKISPFVRKIAREWGNSISRFLGALGVPVRPGIGQRLLHAGADRLGVVLGLDDGQRDVGLPEAGWWFAGQKASRDKKSVLRADFR